MAWLGVSLAILASTMLNIGKGIQKWKVGVLAHGRDAWAPDHRRDAAIWVVGVAMTASASLAYTAALKLTDKPSTVSALGGIGLLGLIVFARVVLKERVGLREALGAALIILGTGVMGLFDVDKGPQPPPSLDGLLHGGLLIAGVFTPAAIWSWRTHHAHGIIFGALAGTLVGFSMVVGDMALLFAGGSIFGQLSEGWVYLAIFVGIIALALTQLAFWRASAITVVPTINSFMILAPLYLQYQVFDIVLEPAQYAAVGGIVVGVILLTMRGDETEESAVKAAQAEA